VEALGAGGASRFHERQGNLVAKKTVEQLKRELDLLEAPETEVEEAPKATGERDIFGYIPDPNYKPEPLLQPQNDPDFHPSVFKIGMRDKRYNEPMAAPPFQYPNPGAEYSDGLLSEACKYSGDRETANRNLRDVIILDGFALAAGDRVHWSTINGINQAPVLRAQAWNWLLGYWAGLGMTTPSETELEVWAKQYAIERLRYSPDELTKPKSQVKQPVVTTDPKWTR
jgi:hypothetical protein